MMCVCVCVFVCVSLCVRVHVCTHVYVYACLRACVPAHLNMDRTHYQYFYARISTRMHTSSGERLMFRSVESSPVTCRHGMESRPSDCASEWRHALINVPADCVML